MTRTPVRITNAHKYYNRGKSNQLHVMDNVNLELPEQGLVAIFGRSGCGKTTLLNTVGGLDSIASGSIELFGQDIRKDTDTLRNRYVGYIFQNYYLSATDTVYENVAAALRLCGMTDERAISARVMAALGNVDLAKYRDRTPDTLSGGQQQRVAIARAIVKAPAILLCDEPTGNLDEANTVLVMDILKELSKTRLVLLVTHEAHLVDHYCDRVIEIVDGHVASDRENEEANGYVTRNKSHIYLGELNRAETETPGVTVEYYGEPTENIRLRVVNQNGKLYLKAEGANLKILDEGSEIKLMEGVFDETPLEQASVHGHTLDMSRLTPVAGKNYGRLYHWKNSIASAWRENFGKKQKKGRGLLRVCLALLAAALVFMTAAFGAGLGSFATMKKDHNENLFYIPLDPETDYGFLRDEIGNHGMDYARIMGSTPLYDTDYLSFNSSVFMTAEYISIQTEAHGQDAANASGLPVAAGTNEIKNASDILITTAVADKLLEGSTVGYLDGYDDLVGMISSRSFYELGNIRLRIAGVVESDELFFYLDSLAFARYIQNRYFYMPVTYASNAGMDGQIKDGEVFYLDEGNTSVKNNVGDQLTINGLTLTVSRVISRYTSISDYPAFVKENHGETVIADPGAYLNTLPEGTDPAAGRWAWLFDHYFKYMPEFYQSKLETLQPYDDVMFEEWAVAMHKDIPSYAILMGYDVYPVCAAYLYREDNGVYPTDEELNTFMEQNADRIEQMADNSSLLSPFDRYIEQHWNGMSKDHYSYILSDADYVRLVTGAGAFENVLMESPYNLWDYGDGPYYSNHLMIRSGDPAATEAYLRSALGEDGFIPPDGIFDQLYAEIRMAVTVTVVTELAVIALMCLCVFFIMRSSFMSRVREVGILRAIGVTKRNLTFRFAVETGLLLLMTVVPGYILSAWFIGSLRNAPLISDVFYFPLWLGAALFAVLLVVSMLFGVLPALSLLRKTPSEILSKYDI